MNKTSLFCVLVLLASATSGRAFSEEVFNSQGKYKNFSFVGAGLAVGETVFSDKGSRPSIKPYIFHHSDYGFIDGSLANLALTPWFGLSGNLRLSEVSGDFDDIPTGIDDRESSGELGVTLGTVGARLTYLHDITDKHNGYEVQLHFGRAFDTPLERLTLSPYVELNYRDNNLSGYIYSVSERESNASGFQQFKSGDTWVYKGGVTGLYDISHHLLGVSKLELEYHDSDSPLVQNDFGWKFSVGAAYRF
ncbi:MipA/OmpV family protein [Photobacterium sp. ZSDE20]|uniref:MipA/OmpV family protein n=1 Tax=Photobacterium pectinilyticum TaxID=2906793 RepID=A0ABT1N135_9GAMM|nr:MipA/OmpV family protein [Photobacterium sp. ZSDE20]MCQ1058460.1 MipA/OmpV family protein [Photobacterium sp. ZSDE20]MDD1823183.1 MipA/OmpV family protein [Photobacterium sp. ZSDE20]